MARLLKRINFILRRKSYFTLIFVGVLTIVVLFLNEDTSIKLNLEYQEQIRDLKARIKVCEDSAAWYRTRREALYIGTNELEHVVREQYHMQRASEDLYIIE